MRIGLTYDLQTDSTDPRQAEFDPPQTLEALMRALEAPGHRVIRLGNAHELLRAPQRLQEIDLVFNIAEGSDGSCREAWVPMLLELSRVPYVGSDPLALCLALDKVITKRLAIAEGIRTPRWISIENPQGLPDPFPVAFPVIIKPRFEGSGRGIDPGAIVQHRADLAARVAWLYEQCREPILIEEFIRGGELTVCLIGNDPPTAYPAIQRPLDPPTRLSCHLIKPQPAQGLCPLVLDEALDAQARRMAVQIFETLGCHDMARVDFRVNDAGQLYFLEINPLPSFDPDGSFGLLAEYLGTTYAQLIGAVLDAALCRLSMQPPRMACVDRLSTTDVYSHV